MRLINLLGILFLCVLSESAHAQDTTATVTEWPREIALKKGVLTYYQPQIDRYFENIVEGRCAIRYQPDGGDMLFGAFWFRGFLTTDREAHTAVLDQIDILKLVFPDLDSSRTDEARAFIKNQIENMDIHMSLDRFRATLADSERTRAMNDSINNTPPEIYYREEPTILISVDGQPLWKKDDKHGLEYVQNSPFFIAKDSRDGGYYINGGGHWYVKKNQQSDWDVTDAVPSNIEKFANENRSKDKPEDAAKVEEVVPKVLVVYKPSELIVTDGKPDYQSVEGTQLLYVANSEDDIIMDVNSQMHYVLISGRWYKSKTLKDGSWSFEEPEALPADFAKIPADSPMGDVLASVPGTDAAEDALLDQVIPQTATVSRKDTKLEVHFDGTPKFKQIPNSEVSYSLNSDKSVLKIGQSYYCVNNGIWFVSAYPEGPWKVSDHRPDEVDQIPPSEPVYNVRYVYVYGYTPEVVYVGYLPGYMHSYVYNGVVVYGTGYYYPYWYGSVYYPRPMTYGFSVHYNPWTGWGFSMSFSYGWIGWGYHPWYRSYWGPCGYHAGYRNGYYNGYRHGYNRGVVDGYRAGHRNAYRNQTSGVRHTATREARDGRRISDRSNAVNKPNNLYSDRQGNVYRRNASGNWEEMRNQRENQTNTREARPDDARQRDHTRQPDRTPDRTRDRQPPQQASDRTRDRQPQRQQPTQKPVWDQPRRQNAPDLNRDYQMRQRGNSNMNRNFQQRSQPQMHQPGMNRNMPSRGGIRRR